uniref:Aspartate aminotransferase, putative n=1 Tax=Entamoeba invadens TaxID=33085 RepID=S0B7V2_ENTIV|nr:aspartate aminotransferase, putative [Entamoeba invadens]
MLAKYIQENCTKGTMIRKMSALATKMREEKGAEAIYDMTIGNPQLPPPKEYLDALVKIAQEEKPMCHGYSTSNGDLVARETMAEIVDQFEEVKLTAEEIVMTCGCAGACNVFLRTVLEIGDEVIIFSPYFLEYPFYIENYGGVPVRVNTRFEDGWQINIDLLKEKLTSKTRVVIINSPQNPTGVVYTQEKIDEVMDLLREQSEKNQRPIWILNDAVYCRVVTKNAPKFSIFHKYPYAAIAYSLSKDVSIAGERVGCLAANPLVPNYPDLIKAIATSNEILGFVHTNKLHMRILPLVAHAIVDLSLYDKTREMMCQCLDEMGIKYIKPEGAFYIFPKIGEYDEWEFCRTLAENGIVTVPGSAFDAEGYFRISLCQHPDVFKDCIPVFKNAYKATIEKLEADKKK